MSVAIPALALEAEEGEEQGEGGVVVEETVVTSAEKLAWSHVIINEKFHQDDVDYLQHQQQQQQE